jgi:hypothetical protein
VGEDWRVTATGYGAAKLDGLANRAAELLPGLDVNEDGDWVFAYADGEASADEARLELEEAASELGVAVDVVVERWNPGRLEWQDPHLPVEEAPEPEPRVEIDFDALRYEVRVHAPSTESAVELGRALRAEGARFLGGHGRTLELGAYDEDEAQAIADDLRVRAPVGSVVEARKLTATRRWLAKQRILGNYGEAADLGGFGPGS